MCGGSGREVEEGEEVEILIGIIFKVIKKEWLAFMAACLIFSSCFLMSFPLCTLLIPFASSLMF